MSCLVNTESVVGGPNWLAYLAGMARDLTLYDSDISGNCYKVRLLLAQLRLPYRKVALDLLKGEARTDDFRKLNPFYRVPFLVEGDFKLAESNAILLYLAEGTAFLPSDRKLRYKVLEWMFFEQNQVVPSIAVSRFMLRFASHEANAADIVRVQRKRGEAALGVLESHLAQHPFLVADTYSIADIALFGYVPLSPEGRFELEPYPAIRQWISRVRAQTDFVEMM
jgi:glutathione S-transferase